MYKIQKKTIDFIEKNDLTLAIVKILSDDYYLIEKPKGYNLIFMTNDLVHKSATLVEVQLIGYAAKLIREKWDKGDLKKGSYILLGISPNLEAKTSSRHHKHDFYKAFYSAYPGME